MPLLKDVDRESRPRPVMPPVRVGAEDPVVEIEVVKGVEGPSVYVDGYRVSGSKPWGGGTCVYRFIADPREVIERCERVLAQAECSAT